MYELVSRKDACEFRFHSEAAMLPNIYELRLYTQESSDYCMLSRLLVPYLMRILVRCSLNSVPPWFYAASFVLNITCLIRSFWES